MAVKKKKEEEFNTGKSILILFVYLSLWWLFLTLFSYFKIILE